MPALSAWWLRLLGAKRVIIDTDDWEGPGGWNDLEPYSKLQKKIFAWQERAGLTKHAHAVTVASRELERRVLEMGRPASELLYLPNAIDDTGSQADTESKSGVKETGLGNPRDTEHPQKDPADGASSTPGTSSASDSIKLLLYTRFFEFDLQRPLDLLEYLRDPEFLAAAGMDPALDIRLIVAGKGLFGEEKTFMRTAEKRGLRPFIENRGWDRSIAPAGLAGRSRYRALSLR